MLIKADDNYYYSSPACSVYVEEKFIQAVGRRYLYEVRIGYAQNTISLKTFRDKQNAQSFAKRLTEMLNQEEPKC